MNTKLVAVYYPNDVIINEKFLKMAALYFDEIVLPNDYTHFLESLENDGELRRFIRKGDDIFF